MIVLESVTRRFGTRLVVQDVTLDVGAGEVFVLLGPNGAGKTTILRMMATLLAPSSGTIRIEGVRLDPRTAAVARTRLGLLTEAPGLWERLTVEANLHIHAGLHGLRDAGTLVDRALEDIGLRDRRDDAVAVLSRGLKQRLALARALLHDPSLVLLDEPTAGLDPQVSRDVRERILSLREQGKAVVVSTHNLDEAERIADRVGLLHVRLMAVGRPDDLRREAFGRRIRIRLTGDAARFEPAVVAAGGRDVHVVNDLLTATVSDPDAQVPALVHALAGAGAAIRSVEDERPSLEDLYLRLMQRH